MSFKVYITLIKSQEPQTEYKKLILMIGTHQLIYELKRKVEKEFGELFP